MGSFKEDVSVYPGKRGAVGKLLLWGPRGKKKMFSKGGERSFFGSEL